MLHELTATRYVTPLREGGSLPAIVDADDGGQYVVKFRGAGQGPKALVAEALAAGLAQALGLRIPAAAVIALGDGFGSGEPDPEIQDLLRASHGANFGLAYLPGALAYDAAADRGLLSAEAAADIVWFDALITNVDRTARNTNLLLWQGSVWLIDHGASLYFHHAAAPEAWPARAAADFPQIADHVLLAQAGDIHAAHERLRPLLTEAVVAALVAAVPEQWLGATQGVREAYVSYVLQRLANASAWLERTRQAQQHA